MNVIKFVAHFDFYTYSMEMCHRTPSNRKNMHLFYVLIATLVSFVWHSSLFSTRLDSTLLMVFPPFALHSRSPSPSPYHSSIAQAHYDIYLNLLLEGLFENVRCEILDSDMLYGLVLCECDSANEIVWWSRHQPSLTTDDSCWCNMLCKQWSFLQFFQATFIAVMTLKVDN